MKIVIDARELRATGTGRYLERLLHYLQEIDRKNDYVVLIKPKDMDTWQPKSSNFTKVSCRFKEFTFGEQLGLLFQIKRLKPDLVHFAMVQQPVLYFGKVVTTMHDLTTVRFRNPAKNWLVFTVKVQVYKWVNKIVAHKSVAIITPTEYVKEDVARFARINSRKVTVTYEASDKISAKPEEVSELKDAEFIMYVGRPQPHKNLVRLLVAYIGLKQSNPNLKLVLVGKKDVLYKRLQKTAENLGAEDVIFTDFVSDGQLKWLYENCLAYVFPSLSEGFGLPALEAMMEGAPVVSSSATCLPEVYGDAVVYFDPTDVDDMQKKIQSVISSKTLRENLIQKGYQQVKKYSWKRMADQTLAVYESVLPEEY